MRLKSLIVASAMLMPAAAMAWPWSTDMMNQPSIKPQEGKMIDFPERSIPVGGIPTKVANREEAKNLKNPIKPTAKSLHEGRNLFRIYCSACHGLTGAADSPVSPKIGAINLTESYVQDNLTEGWIWGTITFGSYVMPAYGVPSGNANRRGSNDLSVEERWNVVNYVKHGLVKDHAAAVKTAAAAK